MSKLNHIEINVSNYAKSIRFYDIILLSLGWKRLVCHTDCTTYTDGSIKIVLSPTTESYLQNGFHRKRTGLNHLAFNVSSKREVDAFVQHTLSKNEITCLYEGHPTGDDTYYAACFEDPDRIKLEVVYAPGYCDNEHWTNQIESNFDPYNKSWD